MQEIILKLSPSKFFIGVFVVFIFASLIILMTMPWFFLIKLITITAVIGYGWYIFRRYGLLVHPQSIVKILWHNGWSFETPRNVFPVTILGDSTITTSICVLRFKNNQTNRTHSCLIVKDMTNQEDYRRLIVALKNGISS